MQTCHSCYLEIYLENLFGKTYYILLSELDELKKMRSSLKKKNIGYT